MSFTNFRIIGAYPIWAQFLKPALEVSHLDVAACIVARPSELDRITDLQSGLITLPPLCFWQLAGPSYGHMAKFPPSDPPPT